jgi:hypothetical protein
MLATEGYENATTRLYGAAALNGENPT